MVVGEDRARVGAETESDRRREAPGLCLGEFAARDATVLDHAVEAHSGGAEALVDVERRPPTHLRIVPVPADADLGACEVLKLRRLGDDVDVSTGAAAAIVGCRPLEHLDAIHIEHVARVDAGIARTIDEDIGTRVEAAELEVCSSRTETVLAGVEADTRRISEHIRQSRRLPLLDDRARHNSDGLRRIEKRCCLLRRACRGCGVASGQGRGVDRDRRLCSGDRRRRLLGLGRGLGLGFGRRFFGLDGEWWKGRLCRGSRCHQHRGCNAERHLCDEALVAGEIVVADTCIGEIIVVCLHSGPRVRDRATVP